MMRRRMLVFASTAMLALGACAAPGMRAQAPAAADGYVYVANQDEATVSLLDRGTREEVGRVDLQALGFGPNAKPHHVVVEPDGSHWYVSLIGENTVLKLDRANEVVGRAEFEVPGLMTLHPSEDLLFVGRSMSAVNPPRSVGIIDRSSMELVDEIEVLYPRPHAIAVRPQGDVVYSASLGENRLAAIDPTGGGVELTSLPAGPTHTLVDFAVSPDGSTMVATGQLTGQLLVFDLADPMRPELVRSIDVAAEPWHPVFSPDGGTVWFANKRANAVTAVDVESWTVEAVVEGPGLAQPHGAVVSPDGRWVFVSNNNTGGGDGASGRLVAIDAERHEIVEVVTVGANATGVGTGAGSGAPARR